MTFLMGNDDAISSRIQTILLAEHCEKLYGSVVGSLCRSLCSCKVAAGKSRATGVFDAGRFTHFNTNMSIVCCTTCMPATMIPRKCLIDSAIVTINKTVDASIIVARAVPVVNENGCPWLRTSDGVEHKSFYSDFSSCGIAGVLCKNRLYELHFIHHPLRFCREAVLIRL